MTCSNAELSVLLWQVNRANVVLYVKGDSLVPCCGKAKLPQKLRDNLIAHKSRVLGWLRRHGWDTRTSREMNFGLAKMIQGVQICFPGSQEIIAK